MSTYHSDTPWSNNPLDIIGSPHSLSSAVEDAILHNNACTPTPATQSAQASLAISVATTSYVADYSLTKDKTVSMVQCLNNHTETLHAWVVSGDSWENPDNVPALARWIFALVYVALTVPGLMELAINLRGMSFKEGMATAFYGYLNCSTTGTGTPTHRTADTSSNVNTNSGPSQDPTSASVSADKSTSKPIQVLAPLPAHPPRSPCRPPLPPKQQSYAAVAKSTLSLIKLTNTIPNLKPEHIVAMHCAAEPSPNKHCKVKSTTPSSSHCKILIPLLWAYQRSPSRGD
ncbi:hypothetical protein NP233_g8681 [Leucocoprinus birnbaumii]|uniref:Uncharacterized protein n=1 Tax=Leucocoprinus birnbaumii TaxID=56174 RepID=A0AAD5YMX1_9AGAR|nr:hypothetical protein NP233_g8681 [Leucocoprinus birnbaumii]